MELAGTNAIKSFKTHLNTNVGDDDVSMELSAKIDVYPTLVEAITQQFGETLDEINGEVI